MLLHAEQLCLQQYTLSTGRNSPTLLLHKCSLGISMCAEASFCLQVPLVIQGLIRKSVPVQKQACVCRYNPSTGERRWTKPPMPAPSLPPGWAAAKDPNTGQKYYFNTATGVQPHVLP